MYIETKEIGPEGLVIGRSIQGFRLPSVEDEGIQVAAIHLSGELTKGEDGVSFSGRIGTSARLACSRCLDEYSLPLDLSFDLFYTTAPDGSAGGDKRVDDGMATRGPLDGSRLHLSAPP